MPGMLDGRVVLITGAAGGFGEAAGLLPAREGAHYLASEDPALMFRSQLAIEGGVAL